MEVLFAILICCLVGLAVLAVLFFAEKKRSDFRYNAMLEYVDRYAEDLSNAQDAYLETIRDDITSNLKMELRKQQDMVIRLQEDVDRVAGQYSALEMDYSQAQDAAKRINDFGSSLASIFDYDPIRAIQKGRNKEAS